MLFWCQHARATWFASPISYKPNPTGFSSFAYWWSDLVSNFHSYIDLLNAVVISCWFIWKRRNRAIFNHLDPNPSMAVGHIAKCIAELHKIHSPTVQEILIDIFYPTVDPLHLEEL